MFMLSMELVDPGDSLSTLLIDHTCLVRCQSESVLAGRKGDGGILLRPDSGGALSLAGGWLMVATAERHLCFWQRWILNYVIYYYSA